MLPLWPDHVYLFRFVYFGIDVFVDSEWLIIALVVNFELSCSSCSLL